MALLICRPRIPATRMEFYWGGKIEWMADQKRICLYANNKMVSILRVKKLVEEFPRLFEKTDFYKGGEGDCVMLYLNPEYNVEIR